MMTNKTYETILTSVPISCTSVAETLAWLKSLGGNVTYKVIAPATATANSAYKYILQYIA